MDPELVVDDDMEPDPALNDVTNRILGAAFAVHSELGPGYSESICESAMAIEFRRRGIAFQRQVSFPVLYCGEVVGEMRADFLVENVVLVELKQTSTADDGRGIAFGEIALPHDARSGYWPFGEDAPFRRTIVAVHKSAHTVPLVPAPCEPMQCRCVSGILGWLARALRPDGAAAIPGLCRWWG